MNPQFGIGWEAAYKLFWMFSTDWNRFVIVNLRNQRIMDDLSE